jgi:hypothetical protein
LKEWLLAAKGLKADLHWKAFADRVKATSNVMENKKGVKKLVNSLADKS